MKPKSHELIGEERSRYLKQIDTCLRVLSSNLALETKTPDSIKKFGEKNKWDFTRLPGEIGFYKDLSRLVRLVADEYRFFDWIISDNPENNRGYFESIEISAESGLPWVFAFMERDRLKKEADLLLKNMRTYEENVESLVELLMKDYVGIDDVGNKAHELNLASMKRNYLEHLKTSNTLTNYYDQPGFQPIAKKVTDLGGESLWNLQNIRYMPNSGMFELYIVDLWQDIREPQIVEGKTIEISQNLKSVFNFGIDNEAWYIIKSIDDSFISLHPVHVSRCIVGPFETNYLTSPGSIKPLDITKELLKEDKNNGIFRFSRQYSYAPNHKEVDGELKQIFYPEDWRDEILICKTGHASRVSKSILGTNLMVYSYTEVN